MKQMACPGCGAELTIEQLFGGATDHAAFAALAAVSIPLGSRVLSYIQLHAPEKNRPSLSRKAKLVLELLPDLQRQAITRAGRDWEAPLAAWNIAIEGMLALRDQGKLQLPLTGHGYLYAILQGMADKVERSDEARRDQDRRASAGARAATRATGSADIGAILDSMGDDLAGVQQAIERRPQATKVPATYQPGTSPTVRAMKVLVEKYRPANEAAPAGGDATPTSNP